MGLNGPDLHHFFFVGDAAGRTALTGKPKMGKGNKGKGKIKDVAAADFSDSDKMFATKIGAQFFDETEFFEGQAFASWESSRGL